MRLFNVGKQFKDNSGRPLSGGSVTFYDPKTLLEATVYSDGSEDTETDNPITLESDGRLPNDVWSIEPLRMVVKDKHGALADDRDNVLDVFANPYRGTWTPTFISSTQSGVVASSDASYLQVGYLLFFNLKLTLSSKPSSGVTSYVSLPKPLKYLPNFEGQAAFQPAFAVGPCSGLNITASESVYARGHYSFEDSSYISLGLWDRTDGNSFLQPSELTDNASFTISGFYTVDT